MASLGHNELTHRGRKKHHFAHTIIKCNFMNEEDIFILIEMLLKIVPGGSIGNW